MSFGTGTEVYSNHYKTPQCSDPLMVLSVHNIDSLIKVKMTQNSETINIDILLPFFLGTGLKHCNAAFKAVVLTVNSTF